MNIYKIFPAVVDLQVYEIARKKLYKFAKCLQSTLHIFPKANVSCFKMRKSAPYIKIL